MKELMKEIDAINAEIKKKQIEINHLENTIKQKISSIGDIVKELALYIKLKNYPTELYPVCSYESGEYDEYKNIRLKIVYDYGYTDVVGLSQQDFERLKEIINSEDE